MGLIFKDETAFVKHLIKELEAAGNLCFRQNPPINKRTNKTYKNGISDIIMITENKSVACIECKMPGKQLSDAQKLMSEALRGIWYTVNPDNYKDKLKEFLT